MSRARFAGLVACALWSVAVGCGGPGSPAERGDERYRQNSSSARSAYDQGLWPQAALLYGRALQRAEAMDNAAYIGDASYNLATVLVHGRAPEDLARARLLLHESARATESMGGDIAEALLLEAKAARFQNDSAGARALIERVLAMPRLSNALRLSAHVVKGDMAADDGNAAAARTEWEQARKYAAAASVGQRAALAGLEGRLGLASHNSRAAALAFERQADLLRESGFLPEMAEADARAGMALIAAGDSPRGCDRLYRAARSAAAQGDDANASAWCEAGLAAAPPNSVFLREQFRFILDGARSATQPVHEAGDKLQ